MLRFLAAMALLLSPMTTSAAAEEVAPSQRVRRAVLIRAEPSTGSAAVGRLAPGESVELDGRVPGWYRVRLSNGGVGFVSRTWTVTSGTEFRGPASLASAETRVHVIDVGTGLAIFVEGPGFTMLYDAGSQDDLASGPSNRVVSYIRAARPDLTAIDHVVLSHPHKDHLELMPDVFAAFTVRNVWDSGAINRTVGYCRFLKAVEAEPGVLYHDAVAASGIREVTFTNGGCNGTVRIRRSTMISGHPVELGSSSSMTVLWRDPSEHSDANENTLVIRLDASGRRVLFAGDAEGGGRSTPQTSPAARSIEGGLIACCHTDLKSDVLIVGHHGSLTSSRSAFLDAVGAKTFVVSSGPHPYTGVTLPDAAVIAELQARGQLLRTDEDDHACEISERKVGPDVDESPGGCSSILLRLAPAQVTAGWSPISD